MPSNHGINWKEPETREIPVVPPDTLYHVTIDNHIVIRIDSKRQCHINPNVNRDVVAKAILKMFEDFN